MKNTSMNDIIYSRLDECHSIVYGNTSRCRSSLKILGCVYSRENRSWNMPSCLETNVLAWMSLGCPDLNTRVFDIDDPLISFDGGSAVRESLEDMIGYHKSLGVIESIQYQLSTYKQELEVYKPIISQYTNIPEPTTKSNTSAENYDEDDSSSEEDDSSSDDSDSVDYDDSYIPSDLVQTKSSCTIL